MVKSIVLTFFITMCCVAAAGASEIHFKNGDRLKGVVVEDTPNFLRINTELLGELNLSKDIIESVVTDDNARIEKEARDLAAENARTAEQAAETPVAAAPKIWSHSVSAGYTTTNGNTKTSAINISTDSDYNKGRNLWKIKNILDYAGNNGRMTTQKYYGKAQSDYRLGVDSQWFNTRSVEVTHDKFANIDYRVLPAIGIGYWFWEGDRSKSEFDLGVGYEYTNFNTTDTKSTGNMSLIPHFYIDGIVFGKAKLSEDVTVYPSLASFADYRLRSETAFINPISDTLSWKLSFIEEYNSTPKAGAKKSDTTFMSSLQVAF